MKLGNNGMMTEPVATVYSLTHSPVLRRIGMPLSVHPDGFLVPEGPLLPTCKFFSLISFVSVRKLRGSTYSVWQKITFSVIKYYPPAEPTML